MNWNDFIPKKTIQALCRHTVAVSFAIGCFALTGFLASRLFPVEPINSIIHWIESIGIASILFYLLIEFFIEILKGKVYEQDDEQ